MTEGDPVGVTLFQKDCEVGIFRASVGEYPEPLSVNVYPRKSQPGFVWLIWDHENRDKDRLHTIHSGGICRNKTEAVAIVEAITKLMDVWTEWKSVADPPKPTGGSS